jgi:hypothetical protein
MEQQIRNLLELNTYEHVYRDLVYFGEEQTFLFLKTVDKATLFAIDIHVRAGIDLSPGVEILRDRWVGSRIYVKIPDPAILSVDADESSIREYFVRERGARIELSEVNEQLEAVKERVAAEALERGILAAAQANAEEMIESLLNMAGFDQVEFGTPSDAGQEQGIRG